MAPAADTMSSSAASSSENAKSVKVLEELLQKLSVSKGDETEYAAKNLASFVNGPIEEEAVPAKFVDDLKKKLNNKKDAAVRERALAAIKAIAGHSLAPAIEPYLVELLGPVLAAVGDKMTSVKKLAQEATLSIVENINPNAIKAILPIIYNSIQNAGKWPEKITALECLDTLTRIAPPSSPCEPQTASLSSLRPCGRPSQKSRRPLARPWRTSVLSSATRISTASSPS